MLRLTVLPRRTGSPADPEAGRGCHHKAPPYQPRQEPKPPNRHTQVAWGAAARSPALVPEDWLFSPHAPKGHGNLPGNPSPSGPLPPSALPAETALRAGWRVSNRQTRRNPDRAPEVPGSQVPDPTQCASANGMQGLAAASRPCLPGSVAWWKRSAVQGERTLPSASGPRPRPSEGPEPALKGFRAVMSRLLTESLWFMTRLPPHRSFL